MEKHGNNLHRLIHVILDFSLSFVRILFSVSPTLPLSFCLTLSIPSSFILSGRHSISHLGSRMRGRSGLCQQRPAIFFFHFPFFLLIQENEGRKRDLSVPFLLSFAHRLLAALSHTSRHWFLPSGFLTTVVLSSRATRVTSENYLSFITFQPLKDEYCGKIGTQVNSFSIYWLLHKT